MGSTIVVQFCGPHAVGHGPEWSAGHVLLHRSDAAICKARSLRAPILVVGDGWAGRDVTFLACRAHAQGAHAVPLFDSGASTLTDVLSMMRFLGEPLWSDVDRVLLVTDPEHRRPLVFAQAEATKRFPGRSLEFVHVHALGGHIWTLLELEGEERGIADYHAGRYGDCRPLGLEAFGKSAPSTVRMAV